MKTVFFFVVIGLSISSLSLVLILQDINFISILMNPFIIMDIAFYNNIRHYPYSAWAIYISANTFVYATLGVLCALKNKSRLHLFMFYIAAAAYFTSSLIWAALWNN